VTLWPCVTDLVVYLAFSALTLLVGWQEGHPACKKIEWWDAGVVICLELGADLHMPQMMPLPLTVSRFSKIQTGFTFLVPAHPGSPGKRAVKWMCVCVRACVCVGLRKGDKHLTYPLRGMANRTATVCHDCGVTKI